MRGFNALTTEAEVGRWTDVRQFMGMAVRAAVLEAKKVIVAVKNLPFTNNAIQSTGGLPEVRDAH